MIRRIADIPVTVFVGGHIPLYRYGYQGCGSVPEHIVYAAGYSSGRCISPSQEAVILIIPVASGIGGVILPVVGCPPVSPHTGNSEGHGIKTEGMKV